MIGRLVVRALRALHTATSSSSSERDPKKLTSAQLDNIDIGILSAKLRTYHACMDGAFTE